MTMRLTGYPWTTLRRMALPPLGEVSRRETEATEEEGGADPYRCIADPGRCPRRVHPCALVHHPGESPTDVIPSLGDTHYFDQKSFLGHLGMFRTDLEVSRFSLQNGEVNILELQNNISLEFVSTKE